MANFIARLMRPDAYRRVSLTDKERKTLIAGGTVAMLIGAGVFGWLWTQEIDELWMVGIYLWPLIVLGLIAFGKGIFFPFTWVETDEEKERQRVAAEVASKAPDPLFEGPWYIRYAVAIVGGWIFFQFLVPRLGPDWNWKEWIIVGGATLCLLALAREAALVVLGIGAAWFVLSQLSDIKITTPGAIIIGALIIAYAIFVTNGKKSRARKRSRRLGRRN